MKEGLSPSKPPSLPRTFPKSTRPYMAKICFAMFGRVLLGKVFLFLGRYFYMVRLSHPFCVWGAFGEYTLLGYHIQPHSPRQSGAIAALFKNSHLPPKPKLPRKTPTIKKAKQNFARVMVGVLWGSSGRLREVWREKEHPPKGGSFSLQGLSIPYLLQDSPRTKRSRRKRSAGRTKVIIRTEETVPMPSRSPTVEIAFCVERK